MAKKDKTQQREVNNQEEVEIEEEPRGSVFMFILNLGILLPAFMFTAAFLANYILVTDFKTQHPDFFKHVDERFPNEWKFEDKAEVLFLAWSHLSIFVIFCAIVVMMIRVVGVVDPLKKNDPKIIEIFNRTIQNTLEQSFVFLGVFGYWLFSFSTIANKDLAYRFVMIFVVGRVTFLIGYILTWITPFKPARALGMGMTLLVQTFLIAAVFGINLVPRFTEVMQIVKF